MGFTKEESEGRRRQLEAIKKMDDETLLLAYAYGYRDPNINTGDILVKAVLESRLLTRVATETKELERLTDLSRAEVKRLADSSVTVERLTVRLNRLTWVLIFLTVVAVLEPIAIEYWKSTQPEKPVRVVVQYPPQTAPQTPALPVP